MSLLLHDDAAFRVLFRLNLRVNQRGSSLDEAWVPLELLELPYNKAEQPRQVMNTGVNVKVGETVVVGTSRVGGGKQAYILLLTALGDSK